MEVSVSQVFATGERHEALFCEGNRIALELMQQDSGDVLEQLIDALHEFNERSCDPPKSRGDIQQLAYRCMSVAAKRFGDEKQFAKRVLQRLSKHFFIHEQAAGTHWSGRRLRIDAIIQPRDLSGWKDERPRFGVEFKNYHGFNPSFDMKDYTKWWSQCHDYAETNFDGHGYVYVFSYNGFSHYAARLGVSTDAAFAVRFWGRLGVGEIQPDDLLFVMSGTNKIWSERRGVIDGARISMERRFGSR
jgi:hypothetical protein